MTNRSHKALGQQARRWALAASLCRKFWSSYIVSVACYLVINFKPMLLSVMPYRVKLTRNIESIPEAIDRSAAYEYDTAHRYETPSLSLE